MKKIFPFLICFLLLSQAILYAVPHALKKIYQKPYSDTGIIIIPFDYKQSALYLPHTFDVIDSVVNFLFKHEGITLSVYGYTHFDEGNDSIQKYLALNRALFVRDYILGRGINEKRLLLVKGMSSVRSVNSDVDKEGHSRNCRAELILRYPPPPPPVIYDRDEDGIPDSTDACAGEFGYAANAGCPDTNAMMIPFENEAAWLANKTYCALDSAVSILKNHPEYTIKIEGHAHRTEGTNIFCNDIAAERAAMVKRYLLSRNIANKRIIAVESFGNTRPINAGKTALQILLNARVQLFFKTN